MTATLRSAPAACLALALASLAGCVAPPREPVPVEPIPPRPLSVVTLPPIDAPEAADTGSADFRGPEPLPPAPVEAAAGGGYTVVRGDTLSGIARRYYGNPSAWKRIAAANPGIDPNNLKVGQVLLLP